MNNLCSSIKMLSYHEISTAFVLQIAMILITLVYEHEVYFEEFSPIFIIDHYYNNISIFLLLGELCTMFIGDIMYIFILIF